MCACLLRSSILYSPSRHQTSSPSHRWCTSCARWQYWCVRKVCFPFIAGSSASGRRDLVLMGHQIIVLSCREHECCHGLYSYSVKKTRFSSLVTEISVCIQRTSGHFRNHVRDVPLQPDSPTESCNSHNTIIDPLPCLPPPTTSSSHPHTPTTQTTNHTHTTHPQRGKQVLFR